jgi:uncharacterized protein (TIGR03435 family)
MRLPTVGAAFCAALALAVPGSVRAQVDQLRSFEVASVRLSSPLTPVSHRITDTRVDLIKMELRQLLWMAFEIDPFCCRDRIPGAEPLGGVLVDIQATFPAGATRHQVPEMMRSLLNQRFGLRTHVEPRPADGYELVVGAGGMQMQEVQPANELDTVFPADPAVRITSDSTEETVNGRVRTMDIFGKTRGMRTITERTRYDRRFTTRGTRQIDAVRMTMSEFAALLSTNTGRPVLDRTNLTGVYAFSIELPPDAWQARMRVSAGITTAADGTPLNEPVSVSVPRGVERLGLKLEPRRIPVDTIVIDRIERVPSAN